ncbi:hypothetical protein TAMA11512_17520 [Selenomonas sp. TAMA-11512]|uniref:FadR/GntR family transcriptional regulator n=1 Tax=Selenomonas sp. TAMA-11512 TaxID=3095337 RepID=UPI003092ACF2|nr:hypothetical protein TAMA11512_17520 [Selenomonas sp. TAMA-11512]
MEQAAAGQSFLKPIRSTSVVDRVIERLTGAMIRRELNPGDRIPTEIELSDSLGVGRNSVREAIKILVSFGVLEIRRPDGTFVSEGFSDKMIDPLLYGIILDRSESLDSLKELREWLDIGMLVLAARHAEAADIKELEQVFKKLKKALLAADGEDSFQQDNAFHDTLATMTKNPLFAKIAKLVRLLTTEIRRRTIHNMTRTAKGQKQMIDVHENMLRYIECHGEGDAESIVKGSYFYDHGALDREA